MNVSRRDAEALADSLRIAEFAFTACALPVLFAQVRVGHVETDRDCVLRSLAADAALFTQYDAAWGVAGGEAWDLDIFTRLEIEHDHRKCVECGSEWPSDEESFIVGTADAFDFEQSEVELACDRAEDGPAAVSISATHDECLCFAGTEESGNRAHFFMDVRRENQILHCRQLTWRAIAQARTRHFVSLAAQCIPQSARHFERPFETR